MKYYNIYIQYYGNQGEYKIPNTLYKVDGYIRETNTVIQFSGSFYHGDPRVYSKNYFNTKVNKTMGELYERTIKISNIIRNKGYNLIEIWEYDWLRFVNVIRMIQRNWRYKNQITYFPCKICKKSFKNMKLLVEHINDKHNEIQVIRSKNNYKVETLVEKPQINTELPKRTKKTEINGPKTNKKNEINGPKTNAKLPTQKKKEKIIYECHTCQYKSSIKKNYERHMNSKTHLEKIQNQNTTYQYICQPCGYKSNCRKNYLTHCRTKTHEKKVTT